MTSSPSLKLSLLYFLLHTFNFLNRNGSHFKLNRFSGKVEFGSTANLVTNFKKGDSESISDWLSDERRVALSIWDEKLMTDLGQSTYRLQLMSLQFVSNRLSPSVDSRMWIENKG